MKRRLIQLVVLVALGVAINLTVAWTLAWKGMPTTPPTRKGQEIVFCSQQSMGSKLRRTPGAFEAAQAMSFHFDGVSAWPITESEFRDLLPAWSDMHDGQAIYRQGDRVHSLLSYHEVANGWPLLSLRGTCLVDITLGRTDAVAFRNVHGMLPTLDDEQWGVPGTMYPYAPIWSGLLLNTLLYASSLWMLCQFMVLPLRFRRRLRLRRGLCPHCAYPIGSSPLCTECGKPLPARLLQQT
jgi:hypothetical protein